MAYTEVLTGHILTVEQWDNQVMEEYIGQVWWKASGLMGVSIDSAINVKEDLMKKAGDAITIAHSGQLQGGFVEGNATGIGNEGRVDFFGQRITVDNKRHLVRVDDIPMTEQRVEFDVLQAVKRRLADAASKKLDEDITSTLSGTSTGRVRGRYLYGAVDSNWNATHATALTNIDNTADQLTTNIIRIAKRKAVIPVNATEIMRPIKVQNGKNYEEWFDFVGHPYCTRDMFDSDAAWKNAQLNIPPSSNRESPIFTGSSFKGAYDGVLLHEYHRVNLVSSTIQVAHNFLLGAQAAAVVWAQRAKFGEEFGDLKHRVSYELHEIRGLAKIVYDLATQEDQGIIHVFAAAVAD